MASQYFAILTDYGTRAIAHALSQGQPLQLTQFAVGDGNGQTVTPTASATALVHQTHIAPVSAVSLDPRNNKQVIVELTIPENVGGFYIREMGVFDSQNKLIAYANCPESFKPTESSGSGKVQVLRMILKIESSSAVTLSIDNSVIFVTRQQMAPKTITATTQNGFDESGHSHEIAKASTTQQGIVQLTNDTGLESESLALTAKAGKKLAQLIATVQLALNNYIPLNKRSSAVNSNDENNVATSKAVKTAYDKGVEARIAAYAANNNANGRVSKSGDTMTGSLAITGSQSGGFANGLMLKNKAGGQNTGVFVDFYQTDNIPRASMWMSDAGNNSTQISFHNTPEGADWNRDSRQGVFTITSSGNLWSKAYGFLHDKFASKSDVYAKSRFRHQWYGNHYEGAEVYDVPMGDNGVMRTIIMGATINGYSKLNLPEPFNGTCRVQVMDVGSGRHVVGANIQNGNVVEVFNSGRTGLNIIAIGWYGW
ncbi:hypothetical protein JP0009_16610 [Helicobacter pylori]